MAARMVPRSDHARGRVLIELPHLSPRPELAGLPAGYLITRFHAIDHDLGANSSLIYLLRGSKALLGTMKSRRSQDFGGPNHLDRGWLQTRGQHEQTDDYVIDTEPQYQEAEMAADEALCQLGRLRGRLNSVWLRLDKSTGMLTTLTQWRGLGECR
ncbi:unnamed protein product [Protopolystoma xenopodis]|uniref:Uncharacterized protein n=1 Tax=Protopolystoma xenopodis TaxID=117903 RepID=A0A448WH84_9PLAT|nr:unnamed protein product [Protopolystoma xenopodis]